jgi:3-oxoadipate enol-lactonase
MKITVNNSKMNYEITGKEDSPVVMLSHSPEKIISLSLCDTAAIMPPETQPVWQERIDTARDRGLPALAQSTMERWFTPDYLKQNPPALDRIRKQFEATPVNGFIGCSEAIRKLDYLDQLSRINLPTLIMVGEDDPGTPVAASKEIHDRIAGSKIIVIPAAAHLSNIEQADFFNDNLIGFLEQVNA